MAALLQVVDALPVVALAHLLADQARHHGLDPLLADDGILGGLESGVVVVVDAVEGGRNLGLLREEGLGLGRRHGGGRAAAAAGGWQARGRAARSDRQAIEDAPRVLEWLRARARWWVVVVDLLGSCELERDSDL